MAWDKLNPWFFVDDEGLLDGFAVALAEELGNEIGVEIAPFRVSSFAEWAAAQASGRSEILPAVVKIPNLIETNVFSDPLFSTAVRFAVTPERIGSFDPVDLTGQRIGILGTGAGSDKALYSGGELITYPSIRALVIGLLADEVDAISAEAVFLFNEARQARLDQRITFVGPPVFEAERFVAVHDSRNDLIEPINEAIARMKSDGRLNALRTRYNASLPEPVPDVLRVGVFDLPPQMERSETGEASGFAVDVLRSLADISGLALDFVPIEMSGLAPGDSHDIIPILTITADRSSVMDFSYPVEESVFSIFVRSNDADEVTDLATLQGRRVAVLDVSVASKLADNAGISDIVRYGAGADVQDLLDDLVAGDVDAVLFEVSTMRALIDQAGLQEAVLEIVPPVLVSQRAIALRSGLGEVRERLNAVIPGFLISDAYANLRQTHFGETVFWTDDRIRNAVRGVGVLLVLMTLGGLLGLVLTQRRILNAESRARASDQLMIQQGRELETIFNAATSAIVALDPEGKIVRANDTARHMLGGISMPTPFDWPNDVRFLSSDTLKPLEASADPLYRALSGSKLHRETHLLKGNNVLGEPRYVCVDSARLRNDDGADLLVLVLDDVSSEEQNRQAVERKGRLDALGQLAGGIAHDFNNLLTSFLYSVVLADRAKTPAARKDSLTQAEASVDRGRALVSRLMAFARNQPSLATSQSLETVFGDFVDLVRPLLEANIALDIEYEEPGLIVYCDVAQLESALMNLVLNSRDAFLSSGRGNRIRLYARTISIEEGDLPSDSTTDHHIEIVVSDNGPGMSPELAERAIDPFFTTKDRDTGAGLGLAMVYGFARQSSGSLRIETAANVGTSIHLVLPRGTADAAKPEQPETAEIVMGQGQTVLLVEDQLPILLATEALIRDFGYDVVSASSGREALDMVKEGTIFDLIITDVVMPGEIGGFELVRQIRALRPGIPVIYCSGYTDFAAAEMGDAMAPVLQKPVGPGELSNAVAKALVETING